VIIVSIADERIIVVLSRLLELQELTSNNSMLHGGRCT